MKVDLSKFGLVLSSRQSGLEARKAFLYRLLDLKKNENIEIDFSGVSSFSPSWADEFLTPLAAQLGNRLVMLPSDNLSVQATLKILQEANEQTFRFKK
ncbi:STAS-like domain-containing protein [Candidatus Falkowbacteria bacterium]|nr:STAS-like domain-containing protein [Candidatus Falkowbacteria bacterium]